MTHALERDENAADIKNQALFHTAFRLSIAIVFEPRSVVQRDTGYRLKACTRFLSQLPSSVPNAVLANSRTSKLDLNQLVRVKVADDKRNNNQSKGKWKSSRPLTS